MTTFTADRGRATVAPSLQHSGARWRAAVIAAVLVADASLHLYWSTGATWPASSAFHLSVAVLGFGVPFRPAVLLPLAGLLLVAAVLVLGRGFLSRDHRLGWVCHSATAAVTVGMALRGLLGVVWMIPAAGYLPPGFYWANLCVYTPLCLALAVIGWGQLRRSRRGKRRGLARLVATVAPVIMVAALVTGAYAFRPPADTTYVPAEGLDGVRSRYVDTPLASFHYLREGEGSPVVLLSPGASPAAAWLAELQILSAEHTVYVVDLPGQGFTALHDHGFVFDLHNMTAAIVTFLDAVGLQRVALAGSSWSGGYALAFAQQHPDRVSRLLLAAPSGLDRPDPVSWEILKLPVMGRLLAELEASSRSQTAAYVRGLFVHPDRATPALIDAMYASNSLPDNVRAMYELEARLDWHGTDLALPETRQPTLVLWGRQDTVLPAQSARVFAARLPRATVDVLDHCGHALVLDCPDRVSSRMAGFLHGH